MLRIRLVALKIHLLSFYDLCHLCSILFDFVRVFRIDIVNLKSSIGVNTV